MSAWAINKPIFLYPNCLCEIYLSDAMSALVKSDIFQCEKDVRFTPKADISERSWNVHAGTSEIMKEINARQILD
jgi:hypothetical protein